MLFLLAEAFIIKIIIYILHIYNEDINTGIGYSMIIFQDMMLQLGLVGYFKHNLLEWDGTASPTKNIFLVTRERKTKYNQA